MSADSFCLEYWSFLLHQVIQSGRGKHEQIQQFLLLEGLVADDVDLLDLGDFAFSTLKLMATRLRSSGVTVVVIATAYLPRLRYCRLSSCSALSSRDLSKMRPSARPTCFRPSFSCSLANSLMPTKSIWEIAGRSCTMTISTSLSTSSRTSLKKPVAYKRLDGRSGFLVVQCLADLDRQVAEYRPGLGTLNSLYPNILDDKRLESPRQKHAYKLHQQHRQEF